MKLYICINIRSVFFSLSVAEKGTVLNKKR